MAVKTLLLIDDDADEQDIFRAALAEVDSSIILQAAVNGADALQQLRNGVVSPDLIFIDINMPHSNGFDTLRELKQQERFSRIPVIVYSTIIRQENIDRAATLGALKCIEKPTDFISFCRALPALLEGA